MSPVAVYTFNVSACRIVGAAHNLICEQFLVIIPSKRCIFCHYRPGSPCLLAGDDGDIFFYSFSFCSFCGFRVTKEVDVEACENKLSFVDFFLSFLCFWDHKSNHLPLFMSINDWMNVFLLDHLIYKFYVLINLIAFTK